MKQFNRWLAAAKSQSSKYSDLNTSLFENRFTKYLFLRLNYFFLRFGAHFLTYLVEFFLLSFIFSQLFLVNALAIRAYYLLISGFYWGVLEGLREEIRALIVQGRKHLVERELSKWLSFGVFLTVSYLFLSSLLLFYQWGSDKNSQLLAAYVFAINLRISIQFFLQPLHSGIYAFRRVYRPPWSIILLELSTFALTLLIWPFFGEMSFPLAMIVSSILVSSVSAYFILNSYRMTDFMKYTISYLSFKKFFLSFPLYESLAAGLAAAFLKIDGLLIVAVFFGISMHYTSLDTINFFYIMVPFLQAVFGWSALFYFDFKRLEMPALSAYEGSFKKVIFKLALIMGPLLWCLYVCASYYLPYSFNFSLALWFLPVFAARSILAYSQIRAFTERRYVDLCLSVAGLLMLTLAIMVFKFTPLSQASLTLAAVGIVSFYLYFKSDRLFGKRKNPVVSSFAGFFSRAGKINSELNCGWIKLSKEGSQIRKAAAKSLAEKIGNHGEVACYGKRQIMWYLHSKSARSFTKENLLLLCEGLAEEIIIKNGCSNGIEALKHLLPNKKSLQQKADSDEIKRLFHSIFPEGKIIGERSDYVHYRPMVFGAFRYLNSFLPFEPGNGFQVSARILNGKIQTIYAVPKTACKQSRKKWHSELMKINSSY